MHRHAPSFDGLDRRPATFGIELASVGRPDHSAASHTEVATEHGQRKDRPARRATVCVSLRTPPDAQHRRTGRAPPLGERGDVGWVEPGDLGSTFERPLLAVRQHLVRTAGVVGDERLIEVAVCPPVIGDRRCQNDVGARSDRKVQISSLRHRSTPRIDHHYLGAPLDRFATSGGKCVFDTVGFAPQMTMRRA